ncbi:MAG: TonB-dependent receptor [Pseudomonadota bacterium]
MKNLLKTTALAAVMGVVSQAASAGVIQGRVSDGSGEFALDGVILRIVETGATATTDRAGEYRFAAVPAGDYTIRVSYIGADVATVTVSVPSDDATATADVRLGANLPVVENILVIGQRGALNSALSQQKAADGVITVLSADAIGQLPDENVAEAVRRAPGVNVLNDQGEGRFVSIRGADPNFVSTTINGVRIPSPEADARQVPLDVIDSDILSSIVVSKSLTPDIDADNIGGNIEIKTLSGLEQESLFFKLKAAGIYTDQVDEFSQRYSGVFANKFLNDTVGVAASVAWQRRDFGSEGIEGDNPEFDDELGSFLTEIQQRDYVIRRERLSAALNLDFAPSDTTTAYIRGLFSDFSDDEIRTRTETQFDADSVDVDASAPGQIVFDASEGEVAVARDVRDRFEEQRIWSVVAGAEHVFDQLTVDYSASYSFADEAEPRNTIATFTQDIDEGVVAQNLADPTFPLIGFPDAGLEEAYFDTDAFEFDEFESVDGLSEDEEWAFTLNGRYDTSLFGAPGYIQAGGKVRLREKRYDIDSVFFDGFEDDLTLTPFATNVDYSLTEMNPAVDPDAFGAFVGGNEGGFDIDGANSAFDSRAEDYDAEENIFAGYVMAQRQFGRVSVIAGLRVEHTDYSANGFNVLEQEVEETFAGDVTGDLASVLPASAIDGEVLFEDVEAEFDGAETAVELTRIIASPTSNELSYTDWLPSVNMRFDATEQVVARLAYYRSLARPNIEAAVPRVEIGQEGFDVEGSFGNPNLDRQRAENIDASLEWYPGNSSVVSIGGFYKSIDDFIAAQTFNDVVVNNVAFDEAVTFVNLEDARIIGFEFNYQQPLDFLPGLLDGFIVNANYTFVDSEVTVANADGDTRETSVPGQSRHVATGILGYEKGPINLRFAATYRDEFLDVLDEGGEGVDRFVDSFVQYDVTAKYNITDQFQLFGEFKNINNRPFVATFRNAGFNRVNSQFEEYGWQARFGLQFTY